MLIIPFWLGVVASEFRFLHISFFTGWLFLYLATYPLLLAFKRKKIKFYLKWTGIYMLPALLFLLWPVIEQPGLLLFGASFLPFFLLNSYFSSINRDRSLLNDVSAIIVFCLAGAGSYYFSTGQVDHESWFVVVVSFLFFLGSTFYVKTMIREKKSMKFKYISWGYHVALLIISALLSEWVVLLAFIPSLIRAVALPGKKLSIMQVGILEIVNAFLFFVIMTIAIVF